MHGIANCGWCTAASRGCIGWVDPAPPHAPTLPGSVRSVTSPREGQAREAQQHRLSCFAPPPPTRMHTLLTPTPCLRAYRKPHGSARLQQQQQPDQAGHQGSGAMWAASQLPPPPAWPDACAGPPPPTPLPLPPTRPARLAPAHYTPRSARPAATQAAEAQWVQCLLDGQGCACAYVRVRACACKCAHWVRMRTGRTIVRAHARSGGRDAELLERAGRVGGRGWKVGVTAKRLDAGVLTGRYPLLPTPTPPSSSPFPSPPPPPSSAASLAKILHP